MSASVLSIGTTARCGADAVISDNEPDLGRRPYLALDLAFSFSNSIFNIKVLTRSGAWLRDQLPNLKLPRSLTTNFTFNFTSNLNSSYSVAKTWS